MTYDRAMRKCRCDSCCRNGFLDRLVLLEIVDPSSGAEVFKERVCSDCAYIVKEFYFLTNPTFQRYYHSA
jgi:hypothetical protein